MLCTPSINNFVNRQVLNTVVSTVPNSFSIIIYKIKLVKDNKPFKDLMRGK